MAHTTVRDWERGRRPRDLHRNRLASFVAVDLSSIEQMPAGRFPSQAEWIRAEQTPLRHERLARNMTMHELARRSCVSISTMSLWERRLRTPAEHRLPQLAAALRMSIGEAVGLFADYPVPRRLRRSPTGRISRPVRGATPLGRLRARRTMTQVQAARALDISVRSLARLEAGESTPTLVLCVRMARLYRCSFRAVADAGAIDMTQEFHRGRWTADRMPEVLHLLRAASGQTAAAVAGRSGTTPRTLRRWEGGLRKPPQTAVARLERQFGLPAHTLPSAPTAGTAALLDRRTLR